MRPHDRLRSIPQADGGEGTLEAISWAVPDAVRHETGSVTGPDGRPTPGVWLELPGRVGVVELAQSSGLPLMRDLDPLRSTTRGLGEVIRHAMGYGIQSLIIGLGGSASTDGGMGALRALGLELLDSQNSPLVDGGGALTSLASFDATHVLAPPPGGVLLLADVTAPLLGPEGAAAVFGPQKGADPQAVNILERGLENLASLLGGAPERAASGAAGGTAYGFATVWGAHTESGARVIQHSTGLTEAITTADVVLTGEGRFDETSTAGKVVGEVLTFAHSHGVPVGIVAGHVAIDSDSWTCSLSNLAGSAPEAIANPLMYVEQAGARAATHFGTLT